MAPAVTQSPHTEPSPSAIGVRQLATSARAESTEESGAPSTGAATSPPDAAETVSRPVPRTVSHSGPRTRSATGAAKPAALADGTDVVKAGESLCDIAADSARQTAGRRCTRRMLRQSVTIRA
jgi:hypothetical protein